MKKVMEKEIEFRITRDTASVNLGMDFSTEEWEEISETVESEDEYYTDAISTFILQQIEEVAEELRSNKTKKVEEIKQKYGCTIGNDVLSMLDEWVEKKHPGAKRETNEVAYIIDFSLPDGNQFEVSTNYIDYGYFGTSTNYIEKVEQAAQKHEYILIDKKSHSKIYGINFKATEIYTED